MLLLYYILWLIIRLCWLKQSPPYYNNQLIGETSSQHTLVYICSYYMENNHRSSQFYLWYIFENNLLLYDAFLIWWIDICCFSFGIYMLVSTICTSVWWTGCFFPYFLIIFFCSRNCSAITNRYFSFYRKKDAYSYYNSLIVRF